MSLLENWNLNKHDPSKPFVDSGLHLQSHFMLLFRPHTEDTIGDNTERHVLLALFSVPMSFAIPTTTKHICFEHNFSASTVCPPIEKVSANRQIQEDKIWIRI